MAVRPMSSRKRRTAKPAKRARASGGAARQAKSPHFLDVFYAIHAMLETLAPQLTTVTDRPGNYYLNTTKIGENDKPVFFAAVQIKKNYVSYHLFPISLNPMLIANISPALRKHLSGKACFNFTEPDAMLLTELAVLTLTGFRDFEKKGLL